jgi:formimidoylglutamate deiminase
MMRAMQRLSFRHILTPDGMLHDRALSVAADGRITAIEALDAATAAHSDGFLALPGIPNAHSHAFQRALAGHGEVPSTAGGTDSFWSWRDAMYRLAARVTPEDCATIARHAYAEMLAAGYTSVAEFHYLHHAVDGSRSSEMAEAVIEAARSTGIRLTLLPVLYAAGGFGEPPKPEQARFVHAGVDDYLALLQRLRGKVALGIAPHSLRAAPIEMLPELLRGARELLGAAVPIHIHVAEQPAEVEQCRRRHGCGPIALLDREVGLDPHWHLVHATHADAEERACIVARGATVVVCPITEAYLGDGLFQADEFVRAGGALSIGSDSNCRIDAFEELRWLEYGQRLQARARARLADRRGLGLPLWQGTVSAGARALGQPVAGIAVGQQADLVVIDARSPALAGHGIDTALDALIVNGAARDVAASFVGGKRVAAAVDAAAFDRCVRRLLG